MRRAATGAGAKSVFVGALRAVFMNIGGCRRDTTEMEAISGWGGECKDVHEFLPASALYRIGGGSSVGTHTKIATVGVPVLGPNFASRAKVLVSASFFPVRSESVTWVTAKFSLLPYKLAAVLPQVTGTFSLLRKWLPAPPCVGIV